MARKRRQARDGAKRAGSATDKRPAKRQRQPRKMEYEEAVSHIRTLFMDQAAAWKKAAERLESKEMPKVSLTEQEPWNASVDEKGVPTAVFAARATNSADARNQQLVLKMKRKFHDILHHELDPEEHVLAQSEESEEGDDGEEGDGEEGDDGEEGEEQESAAS